MINSLKLPPPSFGTVLGRFEASFLTDETLLRHLLLTHPLPRLTDAKFIQVSAVTPAILLHLSLVIFSFIQKKKNYDFNYYL
ncbi:unnamed protein product [Onchocerca flexuosa]|uniref:Uncharacterized protein n=1 Tax=Onchocerca flexuosa TaxID=387005 RepID=A0A183HRE4_9BILA|nr:unnamed protein product [Onchocerca flexuosa]